MLAQVIYPERAEIMWDTVAGILKLADMYEMKSVRLLVLVVCNGYL